MKYIVVEEYHDADFDFDLYPYDFLYDGELPGQQAIRAEGKNFYISHSKVAGGLVIKTLEGDCIARVGEYIARGILGEFYPIKSDVFERSHEALK